MNFESNDPKQTPDPSQMDTSGATNEPVDERASETYGAGEANSELNEKVVQVLKSVYDPEIPVNIYEMGLIYEVRADQEGSVYVKMTLTSPSCPVAGSLPGEVQTKIQSHEDVSEVKVELVWEPMWTMDMISEAARLQLNI